jgi:hypothetical protein
MSRAISRLPVAAAAVAIATATAVVGSNSLSSASSGSRPSQAAMQQWRPDAVRFAQCMRSHGVPSFPTPASPREFKLSMSPTSVSPEFQSAQAACQHVLPGGGQSRQGPAQRYGQLVAGRAFARCLRSHGLASFPDPTSSGQLTHEMLARAGIDPRQPAVLRAADACVGVTHGVITKAAVARFAAGQ